jgi:hypothetical protein
VHRRQHEVPGLRRRQRDPHRLRVAHLANDDDVRGLADDGTERRRKVRRIDANLYLFDHAAIVDVFVLDRVFDGDDVAMIAPVDFVDQRRERRRLARAGGPADDDQAVRDPG